MATAAALGMLEKGAGPVVRRGVFCHFLADDRLDSKMSVESSRKARRYERYWCFKICDSVDKEKQKCQKDKFKKGLRVRLALGHQAGWRQTTDLDVLMNRLKLSGESDKRLIQLLHGHGQICGETRQS